MLNVIRQFVKEEEGAAAAEYALLLALITVALAPRLRPSGGAITTRLDCPADAQSNRSDRWTRLARCYIGPTKLLR